MTKGQQVHKLNEAIALLSMIPSLQPDEGIEAREDAIAILDEMVKAIAGINPDVCYVPGWYCETCKSSQGGNSACYGEGHTLRSSTLCVVHGASH